MTEHDQICAEKYIERVGMCMDSGMTLTHADAVAVAEVEKYKQEKRDDF